MTLNFAARLLIALLVISFLMPPLLYASQILLIKEQALPFQYSLEHTQNYVEAHLLVEGRNESEQSKTMVLRVENSTSIDFESRVNQEHVLPVGAFQLKIPLDRLITSGGTQLEPPYTKMILFDLNNHQDVKLEQIRIQNEKEPPPSVDIALFTEEVALPFQYAFKDGHLLAGSTLLVRGVNRSMEPSSFTLRLDNASSNHYRSRVNQEYKVSPGEFTLSLPLTGLETSGKEPFQPPYTQMLLSTTQSDASLVFLSAHIKAPVALPEQTIALDFGHVDSPTFSGFAKVLQDDPRLSGHLLTRFRRFGDDLLRDGIEGIQSFEMPWPNGEWKLSLWAKNQGERGDLPYFRTRVIKAEGVPLVDDHWSAEDWVSQMYLAGQKKEAGIDGDPWDLIGLRKSGLLQKTVMIKDGTLSLEFSGERRANYLAALTLEPVSGVFADQVQHQRREQFLARWPITPTHYPLQERLMVRDISQQVKNKHKGYYLAAKGTLLNLAFEVHSPMDNDNPILAISEPKSDDGDKLEVAARYGHWHFERAESATSHLMMADTYLRGGIEGVTLSREKPRRIHLQVKVPEKAKAGVYKGSLQILSHKTVEVANVFVQVLPAQLPKLDTPIGLYLELPPYYLWFDELKRDAVKAASCDLKALKYFGFSAVSPLLEAPINDASRQGFVEQLKQLKEHGFTQPVLSIPFRRFIEQQEPEPALESLRQLAALLKDKSLPGLYWPIYDEPVKEQFAQIQDDSTLLHGSDPSLKTAGYLNHPEQQPMGQLADLAMVSHGYGVDTDTIKSLQKTSTVWMYNMPKPRVAAGFYLWKSPATGYLQGRRQSVMSDPFDPEESWEGGRSIYPSAQSCANTLSIHQRLLDLHEATLDYRWLQWLSMKAQKSKKAKALLVKVQQAIPEDWQQAESLTSEDLLAMRQKIIQFAMKKSAR